MAIWMNVTSVSHSDLSDEDIEKLEACISKDANSFIEVIDGDWSLQRELDFSDVISDAELERRLREGETYGFVAGWERDNIMFTSADEVLDNGHVLFFDAR